MLKPGFSGGIKFAAVMNHLRENIAKDKLVRVGFLEGATCGIDNDAPAPEIAYILENGAPAAGIPPRPFFRKMIIRNKNKWGKVLMAFLKKNQFDTHKALMGTGLVMGEQLQLEITLTTDPPNAPGTIEAKGFDKPLEHSKNMKRAVSYEVGSDRQSLASASDAQDSSKLASYAGKTILKGM